MRYGMTKVEKIQIFLCILGIAAGIAIAIIAMTDAIYGSWADYAKFGADFYTEIYSAVRKVTFNTMNIADAMEILRYCLMVGGFGIAIGFGVRIGSIINGAQTRDMYIRMMEQMAAPQAEASSNQE